MFIVIFHFHFDGYQGDLEVVRELLESDAAINVKDHAGWTPLVSQKEKVLSCKLLRIYLKFIKADMIKLICSKTDFQCKNFTLMECLFLDIS